MSFQRDNGNDLPFLVAGGGIGGLITAYALARKGFPVRVFEQAPEFKELGAGIQLGPNIFRAIERVGLKAGMMDDAWVPPNIEMRDALSGGLVTGIPLGEPFMKRFGQPYAVPSRPGEFHPEPLTDSGLVGIEIRRAQL
jgi:2-polyprenyl-6-methoxyphenol hydroxylase-like FAD-dependent oxidoreductase